MITALTAKTKAAFVDGSISSPNSGYLLFGAWTRCNSMVIFWILNVVSREIVDSFPCIDTAFEIWNDLRESFHQSNDLAFSGSKPISWVCIKVTYLP